MPADKHGTTKSHRRPGCIGSGRDKSRVWPLQKMPGHMGGDRVWMSGLRVLRINYQEDVLYIMGLGVPGDSVGGTTEYLVFLYVRFTAGSLTPYSCHVCQIHLIKLLVDHPSFYLHLIGGRGRPLE